MRFYSLDFDLIVKILYIKDHFRIKLDFIFRLSYKLINYLYIKKYKKYVFELMSNREHK